MPEPAPDATPTNQLLRGIRPLDLALLIVNGIIGAGIFGLPSKTFAQIGTWSLLAFLACALIVALVVLPSMLVLATPGRTEFTPMSDPPADAADEPEAKVLVGV